MIQEPVIAAESAYKYGVYVVDDDADVRMSLIFLHATNGIAAIAFESGLDLLNALPTLEPGCVLLDARMPQLDGLQVMARLGGRQCHWPVVIMTGHGDVPMAVQAMKLGAVEFIEKPFQEAVICDAVARAIEKLDTTERQLLHRASAASRLDALSRREQEVLEGLLSGGQNKAVAHRLNLSVRTIEMHRANLLNKLGVRTVQEAAAIVASAQAPVGIAKN